MPGALFGNDHHPLGGWLPVMWKRKGKLEAEAPFFMEAEAEAEAINIK